MIGRPNIFNIFIMKCLELLSDNGILAFIIPQSLLNSLYYLKIREYIYTNNCLLEIINFEKENKFIDTKQSTIGIIIKNTKNKSNYILKINNNLIFSYNVAELTKLIKNSSTLKDLGFKVKTGNITWNKYKDKLTNDNSKILLIYNSNIKNNKLELLDFKNKDKKQYIDINKKESNEIIVVNRGNGNHKYKFTYLYLNKEITKNDYLIENHLNVIYPINEDGENNMKRVLKSFENKKTIQFINLYCGNNGLSKTELENLFPIF